MNITIEAKNQIAPLCERIASLKAAAAFHYKCSEIEQQNLSTKNADKAQEHLNKAQALEDEVRVIRGEASQIVGFRLSNEQIESLAN